MRLVLPPLNKQILNDSNHDPVIYEHNNPTVVSSEDNILSVDKRKGTEAKAE